MTSTHDILSALLTKPRIGPGRRSHLNAGLKNRFSQQAKDANYMKKGFRTKGYNEGVRKGYCTGRPNVEPSV